MILAAILINELPSGGVQIDQLSLSDQSKASAIERAVAGLLDQSIKLTGEYIMKCSENAVAVEGKNAEQIIRNYCTKTGVPGLRSILEKAGYEVPPQRE